MMDQLPVLHRLTALLPLKQRQDGLAAPVKRIHQNILQSLALRGCVPERDELACLHEGVDIQGAVHTLAENDLIVQDGTTGKITGAYPMTTEKTPHEVTLNNHRLFAMCALDAVSIAPVFNSEVVIRSVCHLSGAPILIHQRRKEVCAVEPVSEPAIGIRWQQTNGCAAHSLCTEMVFFKDGATARQWQDGNVDSRSVLTLAEAITVGTAFFRHLLD
ncbi:MAG: alkylmercury lyase family protein [Gammaproteobacteria bacterium]|jgi:mercuric reductase